MATRIALIDEDIYESLLTVGTLQNLGFDVAHCANSFIGIEVAIKKSKPDVLVFSLDTNAFQAITVAKKVRKTNPGVGLVFLTNAPDLRLLGLNEKELPQGFQVIFKNSVTQLNALTVGIEAAIQGLEDSSTPPMTNSSFSDDKSGAVLPLQSLTQVQVETLRLVALGCSNAEIARIRDVTEKAVEHTITRMLQALKIAANPRHNARVLLSREYYRWVEVDNQTPKLVS